MARARSRLDALPRFHAKSRGAWRAWLKEHHESASGVWLVIYKKSTGKPRVDYAHAVEELLAEAVALAKKNGTWSALDSIETLTIPRDLAAAFASTGRARQHFDAFPRSAKRAILEWIAQAKRAETRAKRVTETARLAAKNLRANEWKRPVTK